MSIYQHHITKSIRRTIRCPSACVYLIQSAVCLFDLSRYKWAARTRGAEFSAYNGFSVLLLSQLVKRALIQYWYESKYIYTHISLVAFCARIVYASDSLMERFPGKYKGWDMVWFMLVAFLFLAHNSFFRACDKCFGIVWPSCARSSASLLMALRHDPSGLVIQLLVHIRVYRGPNIFESNHVTLSLLCGGRLVCVCVWFVIITAVPHATIYNKHKVHNSALFRRLVLQVEWNKWCGGP